ncbi:hypothetical protein M426DRAFT_324538 [Hypoxylon sp. CI-4A]|nr:hypothetical protein M426DRAFT_324538 [Hypoxylon sp. CI-4A]
MAGIEYSPFAQIGLQPIHLACLSGNYEAVIQLASEPGAMNAPTEAQTGEKFRFRETPV